MNDGARYHGETPPAHGLKVPSEELARQAVDALRGYAYQIYQSLLRTGSFPFNAATSARKMRPVQRYQLRSFLTIG